MSYNNDNLRLLDRIWRELHIRIDCCGPAAIAFHIVAVRPQANGFVGANAVTWYWYQPRHGYVNGWRLNGATDYASFVEAFRVLLEIPEVKTMRSADAGYEGGSAAVDRAVSRLSCTISNNLYRDQSTGEVKSAGQTVSYQIPESDFARESGEKIIALTSYAASLSPEKRKAFVERFRQSAELATFYDGVMFGSPWKALDPTGAPAVQQLIPDPGPFLPVSQAGEPGPQPPLRQYTIEDLNRRTYIHTWDEFMWVPMKHVRGMTEEILRLRKGDK
jgi:hypothetical protein